ncbi:protein kinase [Actinomadura sp. SCN-SB]|uniref:serine/threonine-protein kinase n=1 Tax=Actinomadura sp. SCN-SB TaxID=3373092 RepID=UPI0037503B08
MEIPGYEILETLGTGGFGAVYRARQLAVRREVALKIDSRVLATERDRRRFMREVTAAGRLSGHPHVVALYDAGVLTDGRPYMVLDLCPNGSLNDRLRASGPFPAAEVAEIGVHIADALAAAHASGVLHRDVKPGNILIDRYGGVALADFGLAAMPQPGLESSATREALTPAYAPPEAFRRAEPAPAGDVYSLAASLYALLSGRPPHFPPDRTPGIAELMAAQARPVPDVPGVPAPFMAVLRQAMAFDPAARTPSAAALKDALAALDPRASAATGPKSVPLVYQGSPAPPPVYAAPSTDPSSAHNGMAGPGSGPAHAITTSPARPRQGDARPTLSRGVLLGAAALVTAGIVGAGALIAFSQAGPDGDGGTPRTQAGAPTGKPNATATATGLGVPVTTANCAASRVEGAQAACPRTAECWGGMVSIGGDTSATRRDCRTTHTWETFAIAVMPKDGETWNNSELERHPTVRGLCSRTVLLASRSAAGRRAPSGGWTAGVLPPSKSAFERGTRVYRCLGSRGLDTLRGAMFAPLDG